MAFVNLWSWKETPQHLGRQRWGCCVLELSRWSVRVCALQKELGVTCAWWTAAMTTALPETMSLVLSITSHLLLAEAQTTSESKLALLIASALLDADLQEFCMHLEDGF